MNPIADTLVATHKELEGRTKSGLAQATARAAEAAAKAAEPLPVASTAQLRDLATSAARIFGWDSDKPQGNTYNTLVLSAEQLEEMRRLCDEDEPYKKPGLHGANCAELFGI